MCKDCGCEGVHRHTLPDGTEVVHSHQEHDHEHRHEHHDHEHDRDHHHEHDRGAKLRIAIEENILSANDRAAALNRAEFRKRGIVAVNLISSPGSGKTALLEKTLDLLNGVLPAAVIVGDQRSDNDARRLENRGAPVVQIETGDSCHLNAEQVGKALAAVLRPETRLLFIENVGNLVCPAAFDLGEDFKIALLSTPEGEDKPIKYPTLFHLAKTIVLTKSDLKPHLDWDDAECRKAIRTVNPGVFIFELSAKTGEGMTPWIDYLKGLC
jgi:hydrogenase nickel incorporation protein HypB